MFIRKPLIYTGIALSLVLPSAVNAALVPLNLGVAGQFNAFIFNNFKGNASDVEGRLAVGGNLNINNFAIGERLTDSNYGRDDLIVGGDLTFTNGRILNGNARSGGAYNHGVDVANPFGTLGYYTGADYNASNVNGEYRAGNPLDFTAVKNDLLSKSSAWGALAATGSAGQPVDLNGYAQLNNLSLVGSSTDVNIFTLTAEQLSNANKFSLDIPLTSWALINVTGNSLITLDNFAFFRGGVQIQDENSDPLYGPVVAHGSTSIYSERVLFNFVDATDITLRDIGFKGSILAPKANVTFYDGHLNGNLIAASFTGDNVGNLPTGQLNLHNFVSTPGSVPTQPVPVPSAVILFLSGLFGLAFRGNKRLVSVA